MLDVGVIVQFALHVHGGFVKRAPLLVQRLATGFKQIQNFVDMLGLIGLIDG